MKLSTLFAINAVIAIAFGLGFVLLPATLISLYGAELTEAGLLIAKLLGAAYLGFGILSWLVRNSDASQVVRAVLLSFFLGDAIGFILSLIGQFSGEFNALGWSTVAIYGLLAAGFGYFYFKTQS